MLSSKNFKSFLLAFLLLMVFLPLMSCSSSTNEKITELKGDVEQLSERYCQTKNDAVRELIKSFLVGAGYPVGLDYCTLKDFGKNEELGKIFDSGSSWSIDEKLLLEKRPDKCQS